MLGPEKYYGVKDSPCYVSGWTYWPVVDWDQRRIFTVRMEGEQEWNEVLGHLISNRHSLGPDVNRIQLSPEGVVQKVSNEPHDDDNVCVFRPLIDATRFPNGVTTVSRAALHEVARLDAGVDLVTCHSTGTPDEKVVFKYYFTGEYLRSLSTSWRDTLSASQRDTYPAEPWQRIHLAFKLKWLHQLLEVADYLNFHLGLVHSDMTLNNMVVNPASDTLMLLDFDAACRIGARAGAGAGAGAGIRFDASPERDMTSVARTIYELITGDTDATFVELGQTDWRQRSDVRLDQPMVEFQRVLFAWCERRRRQDARGEQGIAGGGRRPAGLLSWPPLPDPPLTPILVNDLRRPRGDAWCQETQKVYERSRPAMVKQEKPVLSWQRPPQQWPEPSSPSTS
ncbi:hypothetical protein PWT90_07181 [Aphanocladium album]|nr:hypothetical protein PWT90_07181 [Aphanocladium album]